MLIFYMPLLLPFVGRVVLVYMIAGVVALDKIVVFEVHGLRGAGGAKGVDPSAFGATEVRGPTVFWVSAGWMSRMSNYKAGGISDLALWTKVKQIGNGV